MVPTGDKDTAGSEATEALDEAAQRLYFFPDQGVSEERVRSLMRTGTREQRAWVISHLLRYAQWDDIWTYVDRDQVREIFDGLDLPDTLRSAWARMLKIEAPVA